MIIPASGSATTMNSHAHRVKIQKKEKENLDAIISSGDNQHNANDDEPIRLLFFV